MAEDQIQQIRQMLMDFDTAMLLTHGQEGEPHVRPMAIACVAPNCDLWFYTSRQTAKVHDIEQDMRVQIICQGHNRYLTLNGKARLVDDRQQAMKCWDEGFRTWFPKGVEDPDLLLIFVASESVEYWDNQGVKGIKYMFEAAKAYARGTRPQLDEEHHAKVVLK